MQSQEMHPLEKPRGIDVNHAAPLRHRHGAAVALVFADDLAVHKDRDQGTLWEPPHVGLRGGTSHMHTNCINLRKYTRRHQSFILEKHSIIPNFLPATKDTH